MYDASNSKPKQSIFQRRINIRLTDILGLIVLVATLSLCLGMWLKQQDAVPTDGPGRPITRGEDIYLHLARMGFVDWQAACVYESAKRSASWKTAQANCTTTFLDQIRDLRNGQAIPNPIVPSKKQ